MQGIGTQAIQRIQGFAAKPALLWDKASALAALQPIVSQCDAAICAEIHGAVERLTAVSDTLVVIGTGGASLGAQALCAFAPHPSRVMFLENCDAHSIQKIFAQCTPDRTAWAIISKSGETVETLAASLAVIAEYQSKTIPLNDRVIAITSRGARPLRALAESQGWAMMEHPSDLGGRFSVFSCVGLLPAAFAGIDCVAIGRAAHETWNALLTTRDTELFAASCWFAGSLEDHPLHVVMAYSDRLRPYTQWYKQLWAESLGKAGRGPTPITATGSIDQHSQLQLYLDGAPDKLFTLILPEGRDVSIPLAAIDIAGISYLGGHTMEEIMEASAEATCETLAARNLPLRVFRAPLNAITLCQLMVRTMLETLLVAAMLEVDPYSQPAVEEGKHRARQSLGLSHVHA
jgi:glucose-6-phosphate isomerase